MIFFKKLFFINSETKGFSLIEVMIALTIIAALAVIINSSWGGILLRNKSSQIKTEAAQLLQKKILEIETEYKNRFSALPTEKQTGTFEGNRYKRYSWEWEVQEIDIPDISAIVDPEGKEAMVVAVLENFRKYMNQSIREVQVTVSYQVGKLKPQKFIVPFYIINYDNPISLGIEMPQGMDLNQGGATPQTPTQPPSGGN